MIVVLNAFELAQLDLQPVSTKNNGGFQSMLVGLQLRVDRTTGRLMLDECDLERIPRYAFDYRNGGWQGRLLRIFGRTLGPSLGRQHVRPAA
jgi:hypothetical protein